MNDKAATVETSPEEAKRISFRSVWNDYHDTVTSDEIRDFKDRYAHRSADKGDEDPIASKEADHIWTVRVVLAFFLKVTPEELTEDRVAWALESLK